MTVEVTPIIQTVEIVQNETSVTVDVLTQTVEIQSQGTVGPGVAAGGTTGQILRKKSDASYDTEWATIIVEDARRLTAVREADGNIGGQRVVIANTDGTISYADNENLSHLGRVLGVTAGAGNDGDDVLVIREGLISFSGWSWNTSLPIYLASNGLLSQNVATSGFSQIVGFAESPTDLYVNLREPIVI
jgi:hypothetical protein